MTWHTGKKNIQLKMLKRQINHPVSEFNEFKPRLKSPKNRFN